MKFKKLDSYTNHYHKHAQQLLQHNPNLRNAIFVVTEKLHGANIQITTDGENVRYGSRNKWIGPTDKFFDFWNNAHKLKPIAEALKKDASPDKIITIYGEYFGGGIQKEIDYGEYRTFRFFSMYINGKKVSFANFKDYMRSIGQKQWIVPLMGYCTFEEALTYKNDHLTRIKPVAGNVAEGICIEPLSSVIMYGDVPLVIKSENDKFLEMKGATKGKKAIDPQIVSMNILFLDYITKQRLDNVISKLGPLERNEQIGEYISALKQDAIEEFMRDYPEVGAVDNKTGKVLFNLGKIGFKLIKEHLNGNSN